MERRSLGTVIDIGGTARARHFGDQRGSLRLQQVFARSEAGKQQEKIREGQPRGTGNGGKHGLLRHSGSIGAGCHWYARGQSSALVLGMNFPAARGVYRQPLPGDRRRLEAYSWALGRSQEAVGDALPTHSLLGAAVAVVPGLQTLRPA